MPLQIERNAAETIVAAVDAASKLLPDYASTYDICQKAGVEVQDYRNARFTLLGQNPSGEVSPGMSAETQTPASPVEAGWALFEIGSTGKFEIQRDDELAHFASDEDAVQYVSRMAAEGSAFHKDALARHLADRA